MTSALKLNNGVEMPALGFGVFQTPPEQTLAAVDALFRTTGLYDFLHGWWGLLISAGPGSPEASAS
jgi:hypothetical protein